MNGDRNGWVEYKKMVLAQLDTLTTGIHDINEELKSIRVELAMLKVKSGVWGAMAGLIPAGITFLYFVSRR
jgi:hypothetical protein